MFKATRRLLIAIGKPFYFLLSRLTLAITLLLYAISQTGKDKKRKKIKTKIVYKRFTLPKLKLPEIALPKIRLPEVHPLKLEQLKISLFELKVLSKLKKFFVKKLTRLQKLKLKVRIRIVVILVAVFSLIFYSYFAIFRGLPSPGELEARQPEVSTKIYDRNGNLLYQIYKDQNRTIVPLNQIPPHVRFATLAAEDAEFYSHPGFSIKGIFRALITDIQTGSMQGGSTITQQLVKNTLLTPEKTITRKIKELVLSVEVEATYTKDQILDMYLNEVSYGGTSYGIEEAARSYFGKDVGDLDLAEAAFLAGLTQSPTTFSPFGPNPSLAFQRQKEVLHLMVVNKFITQEQETAAENEKLTFVANKTQIQAPHFVMYIRQLLVDKYGEDMVEKGGLEVTTSLDLSIQKTAEQVVSSEVEKLKGLNVGNGAALVVNPQTGEILAMVGSKDYFDIAGDGNVNVTTSLRQPGSSIKVVNYAYALAHGYTPATIIDDSPVTYVTPGTTPYTPVNYDGKFVGPLPLRSALAQSRNVPAVKVLASYGVGKMVTQGQEMGITTWTDPSQYGLSLTLGGGAVTALDLAKVYSTVADYGKRPDLMPILQVKDYKGRILEKNTPVTTQVVDPRVTFLLTDILKDNNARAPEFGYDSALVIKDHPEVAVKTGTSNDLRDNWTVGYNQNYLVLTWVGNNDNSPMSKIASGITGAAPIWNKIMSAILANQPSIDWKVPDGVSKVNICPITATLPCDNCPTKQEWFLDGTAPTKYCTPDQIQKLASPSPIPGSNILPNGASTQIAH
jgi:1A family penicillin-binding protein